MHSTDLFNENYKDGLVIDIGCGCHTALPKVDVLFDKALHHPDSQKTIATHFGDFHNMDFPDGYFGYVYSNNSIEHSKYPELALKEWTRILKVGGILHIEWPAWLDKRDPSEYRKFYEGDENALANNDMNTFSNLGMNSNWISKDDKDNPFLDVHYFICSISDMIKILPDNLIVLESFIFKDSILIAKKT